jgi:hypothetical protein
MDTLRVWTKNSDDEKEVEVEAELLETQRIRIIKIALGLEDPKSD